MKRINKQKFTYHVHVSYKSSQEIRVTVHRDRLHSSLSRTSDFQSVGRVFESRFKHVPSMWQTVPSTDFTMWRSCHLLVKNGLVVVITPRNLVRITVQCCIT